MTSVAHLIGERLRARPDRPVLTCVSNGATTVLTGDQMRAAAGQFAALYRRFGLGGDDIVLIVLRHGPEQYGAFLGALMIGAIPSFLPFATPKQDRTLYWSSLDQLCRRIAPALIVTYEDNLAGLERIGDRAATRVWAIEEALPPADGAAAAWPGSPSDAVAFLQHSSGTTGLRKGVALTNRTVVEHVTTYGRVLGLTDADAIATWLPLYHDMGLVACMLMPLMLGVPVVALDPFDWVLEPRSLFDAIAAHRCSLAWLPNFAFHHLAREVPEASDLSPLRALINCSEPCRPESFELFAGRFQGSGFTPQMLQTCYAMAENVFAVTQTRLGEPARVLTVDRAAFDETGTVQPVAPDYRPAVRRFLSCGRPIPGVEVRIVDQDRAPLPAGRVGEIAITGTSLFSGYFRQPDLTEARFRDGWYHSGDYGFLWEGELYVTGRRDDLIILFGRNYYAHDFEFAANQVAGVIPGRIAAIGVPDGSTGSTGLVLLAETGLEEESARRDLIRALRSRLIGETGAAPAAIHLLRPGELIKTTSGKISRRAMAERYADLRERPRHDSG